MAFSPLLAGKWDDLKQHLEKGRPPDRRAETFRTETSLHLVVVVGIDLPRRGLLK